MASNDVVLLDKLVDEYLTKNSAQNIGDAFEGFVFEQLLKDYNFSSDEIDLGWVDGGGDGGVDGFYILINGILYDGEAGFVWPKSESVLEVKIITCKHDNSFKQDVIDALFPTLSELFDYQKTADKLNGVYSDDLLNARDLLDKALEGLSNVPLSININIVYACRGSTDSIGKSVQARANQLSSEVTKYFSDSCSQFKFVGSTELIALARRYSQYTLRLPCAEQLSHDDNNYVVICTLSSFFDFITDDSGSLRRYLFDLNVRGFLGYNNVNQDIRSTLLDENAPNFWWLNNGVTIVASGASVRGKVLYIENAQIVNGLQTTETIYRHFNDGEKSSFDKNILVKVLVTDDPGVRSKIIHATNNQTCIPQYSLRATDKVQRDIEEILAINGLQYKRQMGEPQSRVEGDIVDPLYLASAYVSLVLRNPAEAASLRSRFMLDSGKYNKVFTDEYPLDIWVTISRIYKQVDEAFRNELQLNRASARIVTRWRSTVAMGIAARLMGSYAYRVVDLVKLKDAKFSSHDFQDIWNVIKSGAGKNLSGARFVAVDKVVSILKEFGTKYGIDGEDILCRQKIGHCSTNQNVVESDVFLNQVLEMLPEQPWPRGVHVQVANKLDVDPKRVANAISILIKRRLCNKQVDGVVFDKNGAVIAIDSARPLEE